MSQIKTGHLYLEVLKEQLQKQEILMKWWNNENVFRANLKVGWLQFIGTKTKTFKHFCCLK